MTTVDENRLKGNWGALHVAGRLAAACLVRPVADGTDVGVDLFCESIERGQAFLHFWVQVKTGAQCSIDSTGTASCYFDRAHLEYWLCQPVPVFAALVPGGPDQASDPDVYVIDVTSALLETGIKSGQAGQSLKAQYKWPAGNRLAVSEFVSLQVPTSSAILRVREGVIAPTPTVEAAYFSAVPLHPVSQWQVSILQQLRRTAALSILSLKVTGEWGAETANFRRRLAGVLEAFDDDRHWETHAARAFSHHVDSEYEGAIEQYHRALHIIEIDPATDGVEEWEYRVLELQQDLERAEAQAQLEPRRPA